MKTVIETIKAALDTAQQDPENFQPIEQIHAIETAYIEEKRTAAIASAFRTNDVAEAARLQNGGDVAL